MIDLPMIPYIVFSIVFVIGLYLGYKRGWLLSVYAFTLTLISIGISIGILFIVYDYLIDFYREYIMSRFSDADFDLSETANIAREPVGSLFVSIIYLPIFGLLLLSTHKLYIKLKKKMYPSTIEVIAPNVKKSFFPNRTRMRIQGLGIATFTSLAMSSIVMTSLSSVFTSSVNYSWFNTFTDSISQVFSAGVLGNSISYQYVIDFLPLTKDSKLMGELNEIINPTGNSLLSFETIDNINNHDNFTTLDNVFTEKGSTNSILKSIYNNYSNKDLWNPIGDEPEEENTNYTSSISNIESQFNNNTNKLKFSKAASTNIINWIMSNSILSFSETLIYQKWQYQISVVEAVKENLADANTELNNRIKERDTLLKTSIPAEIKNRKNIYAKLLSYQNEQKNIKDSMPGLENIMLDKEQIRDTELTFYIGKKDLYDNEAKEFSSKEINYNYAKSNYDSNVNIIKVLTTEISDLNSTISSLRKQQTNLINQQTSKMSELSELQSTEFQKESSFNTANNAWISGGYPTEGSLYDAKEKAIKELADAKSKVYACENELDSINRTLTSTTLDIGSNITSLSNAEKEKEMYESQTADLNNKKQVAELEMSIAKTNMDDAKKIMDAAQSKYDAAQSVFQKAKSNYDSANTKNSELLSLSKVSESELSSSLSLIISYSQRVANLNGETYFLDDQVEFDYSVVNSGDYISIIENRIIDRNYNVTDNAQSIPFQQGVISKLEIDLDAEENIELSIRNVKDALHAVYISNSERFNKMLHEMIGVDNG